MVFPLRMLLSRFYGWSNFTARTLKEHIASPYFDRQGAFFPLWIGQPLRLRTCKRTI